MTFGILRLGDADRVCFANRSIPALSAGVQTMRARICSAFSCDMFARVVWLRLRRAAKLPTFDLSLAAHARHALLLATNSCTPHGGSEGGRRESSLLTFGTFRH